MFSNTTQLYDSQGMTSEGISSLGYSATSSQDGLNNSPDWDFVYGQEFVSIVELSLHPFQFTTSNFPIFDQQLTLALLVRL
jgi:hypothetical protein